jgi:hypothetical protein
MGSLKSLGPKSMKMRTKAITGTNKPAFGVALLAKAPFGHRFT